MRIEQIASGPASGWSHRYLDGIGRGHFATGRGWTLTIPGLDIMHAHTMGFAGLTRSAVR
ncbi:hypothetical protein ABZ942_14995 [Nocardia sp. NPDC046473]|uniref:hypothetical protein n=1 Tax=Nocardia sp. NPDC046473 TaxID=3155733 RepID=UPI0033DF05F3